MGRLYVIVEAMTEARRTIQVAIITLAITVTLIHCSNTVDKGKSHYT